MKEVSEVLEELEEQKERACGRASGRRGLLPKYQELPLGWSPGACTHRQLWTGCYCHWSRIAAALQEPRSQRPTGAARACGMRSCPSPPQLLIATAAALCTQTKNRKKVLYLSSCHPVSSLGPESNWRPVGKGVLEVYSVRLSVLMLQSIGSAVVSVAWG